MTKNVENNETLKLKADVSEQNLFKLHPAQEDIYYDQLLNHQNPKNNLGGYTTIEDVDLVILQQAWELLHAHLDALQLTITTDEDGAPLQYIQQDKDPSLVDFHDFSVSVDAKNTALDWMQQQVSTHV